jgi:hypothetical protein
VGHRASRETPRRLWPYTEGKSSLLSLSGSVVNPNSIGPVELDPDLYSKSSMSSGRPIWLMKSKKVPKILHYVELLFFVEV